MRRIIAAGLAALLLAAGPTFAGPAFAGPVTRPIPPSARASEGALFQDGPESLRLPIPAGLCEPRGVYASFAGRMMQLAKEGRLLLLDCGEMDRGAESLSHMLLITSVTMPGMEGLDAKGLAAKMAAMPASTWGAAGAYAGASASDKLEGSGLVKNAEMRMGITPVGAEGGVFYMTSVMQMSGNGRSGLRVAAMAITVVRGRPLMITIAREGNGPDDVAAALAEARAAVAVLIAANTD